MAPRWTDHYRGDAMRVLGRGAEVDGPLDAIDAKM